MNLMDTAAAELQESTDVLIMVPTALERSRLEPQVQTELLHRGFDAPLTRVRWAGCGFGPACAGIFALHAIQRYRPTQVWLAGIAGRYAHGPEIGQAFEPDFVSLEGIGAWDSTRLISAAELGWKLWQPTTADDPQLTVGETLKLGNRDADADVAEVKDQASSSLGLLTVCAASGSVNQAQARSAAFPNVAAEEMEGYSVAVAAALCNLPLTIVRGISNEAGDREHRRWQIADALSAVALRLADRIAALEAHLAANSSSNNTSNGNAPDNAPETKQR